MEITLLTGRSRLSPRLRPRAHGLLGHPLHLRSRQSSGTSARLVSAVSLCLAYAFGTSPAVDLGPRASCSWVLISVCMPSLANVHAAQRTQRHHPVLPYPQAKPAPPERVKSSCPRRAHRGRPAVSRSAVMRHGSPSSRADSSSHSSSQRPRSARQPRPSRRPR